MLIYMFIMSFALECKFKFYKERDFVLCLSCDLMNEQMNKQINTY